MLTPEYCTKNKIKIYPRDGFVQTAVEDVLVPRVGVTEPIKITNGDKSVIHRFEVMQMPGDTISIGLDIMSDLGIGVFGLQAAHNSRKKLKGVIHAPDNDSVMCDAEPPAVANHSPVGTPEEREKLMAAIQPLIDANQAIPKSEFCQLPGALIELPTPHGKTAYRRQYSIPFALQPELDKAVAQWLDDGVIREVHPVNV
ncbi:hypothetical protein BC940DRAFT_243507, partial [Gongronella butleri]